ncbi:MAG: response regulator [Gemmatimonadaceae bacterium]|jgi:DNA-binding response OmpR family regulator|nr:response regulator [Gemmatimonadaceae bacterium]
MHVLVADDDEEMQLWFEAMLASAGHTAHVVGTGTAALAAWTATRPTLVLLDWQMPGMDGIEVCRRIREAEPGRETFVMVVTARDGSDDLRRMLDAGADEFVSKPLSADVFATRLSIAERRIELAAARRSAEAELVRAKFLSGIGETAIAVQHEINNPLTALLGSVALIKHKLVREDEIPETLEIITEQAERIAQVVKRLSGLREPRSVEYLAGKQMIDLSAGTPPADAPSDPTAP